MELQLLRLLIDFGLVVLIFLVQLCIYPAFTYYKSEDLKKWHATYTDRIALVVLPLMLGQLMLSFFQIIQTLNFFTMSYFVLVGLSWVITFLVYVPLHRKIDTLENRMYYSAKIVKLNWWRVVLWCLVFGVSLFNY